MAGIGSKYLRYPLRVAVASQERQNAVPSSGPTVPKPPQAVHVPVPDQFTMVALTGRMALFADPLYGELSMARSPILLLTTLKTTPRRASQRQVPFAACTPKQATRSSQRWAAVPAVTTVASTMLWSLTLWTAMRGSMVNKAYDARHTYEAKET